MLITHCRSPNLLIADIGMLQTDCLNACVRLFISVGGYRKVEMQLRLTVARNSDIVLSRVCLSLHLVRQDGVNAPRQNNSVPQTHVPLHIYINSQLANKQIFVFSAKYRNQCYTPNVF